MTTPTPEPDMTPEQFTQAIVEATRTYIMIVQAYPRDSARIAAARAAIDDLRRTRAELYG